MGQVTVLPQVTLTADGAAVPAGELRALVEMRVQQRLSLPAQCELVFRDPPGPLALAQRLVPGTALRAGVDGRRVPLFTGEVTAVEQVYGPAGEREVRVRGYDLLHRLRKRQSVRAHVQTTPRDLARELTGGLGLRVEAVEPGPLWPRLIQGRQPDLELLAEVAGQHGLYLTLRDETLHLITLEGVPGDAPLALNLGESLLEARVDVNGQPACRAVTASGWNVLQVDAYRGRASAPRSGRRVAAAVPPERVGGDGERAFPDEALHDTRQAEALAQAELDRRFAHEVILWGIAEGDPRLRPGTPVVVSGVDEGVAGRYVLTSVDHTLDAQRGFLSELSTRPPAAGARTAGAVVALGRVTRVNDPQDLGRVKVSLPTYDDVETEWVHVMSAGAGADKGLVMLPDVGDRVLVLFSHGDPGQTVVLGGLYGAGGAPDSGVEGNAVRRYTLQTPRGQRIQFDDAGDVVRLENGPGSYVELSPGRVTLHAAAELVIEAPGQSIVIRGQSIDFQRG